MSSLFDLLKMAQRKDVDALENIINKMNPKIRRSLTNVPIGEREDLEQELKIKLIEAIKNYKERSVPGFWNFVKLNISNHTNIFNVKK